MISAKLYFALVIVALDVFSNRAFSEAANFSVNAPAPVTQNGDQQSGMISDLKYRAVVEYLQGYLGARYKSLEKAVTPEFAERYILDYKVGRSTTDRNLLEVTGHLDSDSLKRWARLSDTKSRGGSTLRPVFLFTSTFPGLTFTTGDAGPKLKESTVAQILLSSASTLLQKFGVRVTAPTSPRIVLAQPATTDGEIKNMATAFSPTGFNTALWFHLSPCKSCGGSRLDSYFYNLLQGRILLSRSDDLVLEAKDLANTERVRRVIQAPLKQFQTDFEGLSSSGELFNNLYHVQVEGIETYRAYKAIETELSRLDALNRSQLVRAEYAKKLAEFEVTTQLTLEELRESLKQTDFARANLRITVR